MKRLQEELREELRKPFGEILSEWEVLERIKKSKGLLFAVGDVCAFYLLENGVSPDILIYDLKYMRKEVSGEIKTKLVGFDGLPIVVRNPAGFITNELVAAVKKAVEDKKGKIFVEGEEDLAALVVMVVAPKGSVLVYGQPNEGMVFVELDDVIRKRATADFSRMEEVDG